MFKIIVNLRKILAFLKEVGWKEIILLRKVHTKVFFVPQFLRTEVLLHLKKTMWLRDCVTAIFITFFLRHSFTNRFWQKFLWMLTIWRYKFWIFLKIFRGNWRSPFYLEIHFFHAIVIFLFTSRSSDLTVTLTYVLIDNLCTCLSKFSIFTNIIGDISGFGNSYKFL